MGTSFQNVKMTGAANQALTMAAKYNLRLTSSYRSSEESVRVGGYSTDDHTKGLAFDFAGSKDNMDKFAKWAKSSGLFRWVGWQVAGHYNHVHVSWTTNGQTTGLTGTVAVGSSGSIVKAIQSSLAGLKVDGIFGSKTKEAVKQFQANRNLTADGIVGKNTWSELTKGNGLFYFR